MDSTGITPVMPMGGDGGFGLNGLGGIFALLILLGIFNGGFGGFGGNNGVNSLNADMQRGFDNQNSMAQSRDILSAVTNGTSQTIAASTQNAANAIRTQTSLPRPCLSWPSPPASMRWRLASPWPWQVASTFSWPLR